MTVGKILADILVPALRNTMTPQESERLHRALLQIDATVKDVASMRSGSTIGNLLNATDVSYITAIAEAGIPHSRLATSGNGIDFTDAGAGGAFTISADIGTGLEFSGGEILVDDAMLIRLYDNSAIEMGRYAATAAGFTSALAAAATGDAILVPPVTLAGNYTMTAGVHVVGISRFGTIFTGAITGAADASVENLSITRTANDGNALSGIVGQASGTFYVHACHIKCTQSGAGTAAGVRQDAAGTVEVWSTKLLSGSAGNSYGTYRTAGIITVDGGATLGSTAAIYDP
jgi:hypothetical protein